MYADIDECDEDISGCTQICNNLIGSYNCTCYIGFYLLTDNHTCRGEENSFCLIFPYIFFCSVLTPNLLPLPLPLLPFPAPSPTLPLLTSHSHPFLFSLFLSFPLPLPLTLLRPSSCPILLPHILFPFLCLSLSSLPLSPPPLPSPSFLSLSLRH